MATNDETKLTCENSTETIPALFGSLSQPQHGVMKKMLDLGKGLQPEHQKILDDFALNFMINNDDLVRIQKALPALTKLHDAGLLNDTMGLLELFLKHQSQRIEKEIEQEKERKNLEQTANASKSHSKYNEKTTQLLLALEIYLDEVEDEWPPKVNDGGQKIIRNAKTNKENAKKKVFKKHQTKIEEILHERNCQIDFFKAFSNAFDIFTDWYCENTINHVTRNGCPREKRAGRSEESKEKTRRTILEKLKKMKEKK
ncbi:MAG: hypothetical protein IJS08_17130 [Victivallales bacterium]|nr:hypothetical protein [Victivallales bacterium]